MTVQLVSFKPIKKRRKKWVVKALMYTNSHPVFLRVVLLIRLRIIGGTLEKGTQRQQQLLLSTVPNQILRRNNLQGVNRRFMSYSTAYH
jgi:hypothetical protein